MSKVLVIGTVAVATAVYAGGAFYTKSQADDVISQKVAALNDFLKEDNVHFSVAKKESRLLGDVYDISIDGCGSADCRVAETSVSYGFGSVNAKISLSDAIAQKIGGDQASFVKSVFDNMTVGGNVITGKMFMRGKFPQGSTAGTHKDAWYRFTWADAEYDISFDKQSYKISTQLPELSADIKHTGKSVKWDFRKIALDTDGACSDALVCGYKSDLTMGTLVSGEFVALDGRISAGVDGFDFGAVAREMCGLQGYISEIYSGGFVACLQKISTEKAFLGGRGAVIPAFGGEFAQFVEAAAKINGGKAVLTWNMQRSGKEGVPTLTDLAKYLSLKFNASIDQKFVNGLPYGVAPTVNGVLASMAGGADDPYKFELTCDSMADMSSCELNGKSLAYLFMR